MKRKKVWMICKYLPDGKYFDGFYGSNSCINCNEQIFSQDDMPYKLDSEYINIVVGIGKRPTVSFVAEFIKKI